KQHGIDAAIGNAVLAQRPAESAGAPWLMPGTDTCLELLDDFVGDALIDVLIWPTGGAVVEFAICHAAFSGQRTGGSLSFPLTARSNGPHRNSSSEPSGLHGSSCYRPSRQAF